MFSGEGVGWERGNKKLKLSLLPGGSISDEKTRCLCHSQNGGFACALAPQCFSFLLSLLLHTRRQCHSHNGGLACALAIQCFASLLSVNQTWSACTFMTLCTHRALEYQATQCGQKLGKRGERGGALVTPATPRPAPVVPRKQSKAVLHACKDGCSCSSRLPLKTRSEAFF